MKRNYHYLLLLIFLLSLATSCKKKEEILHVPGSILAGERDPGLYYRDGPGDGIGTVNLDETSTISIALEEEGIDNVLYFALTFDYDASLDYLNQSVICNGNSPRVEILSELVQDTTYYCLVLGPSVDTLTVFSGYPTSDCQGTLTDTLITELRFPKQIEEGEEIGPNSGLWTEGPAQLANQFQELVANGNTNGDYLITKRQHRYWPDNNFHYLGFRLNDGTTTRYGYARIRLLNYNAMNLGSVCIEK